MKKLLFGFIMIVLLNVPNCVLAASSLTIECDENNVAGTALVCALNVTIEESEINKIEGDINFSDATTTFELESGITGNINNNKLIINSEGKIESSNLGKIKIKYPIDTTGTKQISISNIKLYNNEEEVAVLNNASDTTIVKSNVNTLETLTVEECDGCKLSPEFKSDLTMYVVNTTSNTIKITAKANENAKVSGTGIKKISKEKETFEIVVTSEAGNTKKYKINVKKVEPVSSDNSLKSLTLNSGQLTPKFDNNTTSYTATVDKEEVVISATANDSKAKVNGIGTKKLNYGKNDFSIVVTAEDGTAKNYLIVINRPDNRNTNAYLKELTINGEKIGFEKDIIEYSYTVGINVNNLEILATPELATSKVTVTGDKDLKVGENEVVITVTAEDESTKEYKIVVVKKELETKEVLLQNLTIDGYNIDFKSSTFEYNLVIKDETKLNIITIPENENYNIEVLGNENLKNGSIIKIVVSNENGDNNIYKIKINVDSNSDIVNDDINKSSDTNYIPIIMVSLLIILVILNIIQIVKRSRKK